MSKLNAIVQYIKDSQKEMKKVTWPTKKDVKRHTLLVIGVSLAVAAFLGIIDYVLTIGLEQII
jgi:preprotein translocase subunit SecE